MKRKHIFAICLMTILATLIYLNSFSVPFHFDDIVNIVENSSIHLEKFSLAGLGRIVATYPNSSRPVAFVSLALNYYFGKFNVFGYHLVNLIIHIIAGIALYFFLYLTLNLVSANHQSPITNHPFPTPPFHHSTIPLIHQFTIPPSTLALLISLLWLAHPVQTQAVTYIVQRMASLATMFYLLSLVFYIKGRVVFSPSTSPSPARGEGPMTPKRPSIGLLRRIRMRARIKVRGLSYFFLSLIFAIFSFGTKEFALSLPIVMIFYEIYFFARFNSQEIKRRLKYLLPLLILFLFAFWKVFQVRLPIYIKSLDFSRILYEFPVVLHYLGLLILPLPSRLTLDYGLLQFSSAQIVLSAALLIILLFFALWVRKKDSFLSFFIIFFLLTVFFESGGLAILKSELAFEHRLYLPSIGFVAVLAGIVLKFATLLRLKKNSLFYLFSGILVLYSVWTVKRNYVWQDKYSLWLANVKSAPNSARAHYNLANVYATWRKDNEAIEEYSKAMRLDPGAALVHNNLAMVYLRKGDLDSAISEFKRASELETQFRERVKVTLNLGNAYLRKKNFQKAKEIFEEARKIAPDLPEPYTAMGFLLNQTGEYDRAIENFKKALTLSPGYAEAQNGLVMVYFEKGDYEDVAKELAVAEKKGFSMHPEVYFEIGNRCVQQERYQDAIKEYQKAIILKPDYTEAHLQLGNCYQIEGDEQKALVHYGKLLALDPNSFEGHYNLGMLYLKQGRNEEAIRELETAAKINPLWAEKLSLGKESLEHLKRKK